jgi:hypothetical protein
MADRYQDRPFSSDDGYDHSSDQPAPRRDESDPLAELARLIGQTDPFGTMRGNRPLPPRPLAREPYQSPASADEDDAPPAGPPPWMQRANRQEVSPRDRSQDYPEDDAQDYPNAVHPLQRYADAHAAREPDYQVAPQHADEPDPSRYDEALYGQLDTGAQDSRLDPVYAENAYTYQDGDDEGEHRPPRRRGGLVTVAVVLALAVVGTGAAFAYRTYVGTARSGEPPIIRADAGPTKIVPAPSDGTAKVPDRMATSDGAEKIVPREEAPVDVTAKSGPRVVFPPLNPNSNPPPAASLISNALPPGNAANGTLPNNEPRKIKTVSVRGEQPDGVATPVGAPPPSPKNAPPARATGSAVAPNPSSAANTSASAPLSLAPQGVPPAQPPVEPRTRVATTTPTQTAPAAAASSGGYLVQVSSQRNEADAQSSYRALQVKFPAVLGSRQPVIKRADLADKGVYYRAMVGPFGTPEEASQFCGSLKSAGGQCVVQRN